MAFGCSTCGGPWAARPLLYGGDTAMLPGTVSYQIRPFEPAFLTTNQLVTAIPYSPPLLAAVSPVMQVQQEEKQAVHHSSASVHPASVQSATNIPAAGSVSAAGAAAYGLYGPGGVYNGGCGAFGPGYGCSGYGGGKCCGATYSPLPPAAVQAWAGVLGCGGRCVPPGPLLDAVAVNSAFPLYMGPGRF
jgi:hypothetical protein